MSDTSTLTLKGVDTDEELRRAHLLMAAIHRAPYQISPHWLSHHAQHYPRFQRAHTRIALSNGEVLAALRISTDIMRIGEARLKVAGISWIAHDARFSKEQALFPLLTDTLDYLKAHRYPLALLFAPFNAYAAHGFTPALYDLSISLHAADIPPAPIPRKHIRPIKPGDIPALLSLYAQNYHRIPCSTLREYTHLSIKWEQIKHINVLTDAQGKLEGYLLAHAQHHELHIYEIAARDEATYTTLLAYVKTLAPAPIIFHIPPEHPLTPRLNALPSTTERRHDANAPNGLLRIIDLDETLESMIPEWEHQVHKSLLREMDCEVTLIIDATPYRIRVHYGVIDIAKQLGKNKFTLSPQTFTQILNGFEHLDEIWSHDRRLINREGKALLHVLFPKRSPYITPLDRC